MDGVTIGKQRSTVAAPIAWFDQLLARAERLLARPLIWATAIAAVLALQATLILSHHAWFDEWQALQIAVRSPTLADLLHALRYEGHPPLWYLVLRGVDAVVPAAWVLPVVALLLAVATQLTILTRAPFPRLLRLALALNAFVLFDYLTLSRSMTLGVALAVAAVALQRSRWRWLAIALLPLCDFLFGVISVIFVGLALRDRQLCVPGVILWLAASLFAAWSVIPAPDMVPALDRSTLLTDAATHVSRMGVLLVPWQTAGGVAEWNGFLPFGLGAIAGPLFAWFAWMQTAHSRVARAAIVGMMLVALLFSIAVYPLHVRHLSLVAFTLVLLQWHAAARGTLPDRLFSGWLIVGAACGLAVASIALTRPFDTAHLAAQLIEREGLADKHWLVFPQESGQVVNALTGIEFERLERNCMMSYVRWDARASFGGWGDLHAELRRIAHERGRSYLLSNRPLELPLDLARPIATVAGGYNSSTLRLYVIGPALAERRGALPQCVPGLRPLD